MIAAPVLTFVGMGPVKDELHISIEADVGLSVKVYAETNFFSIAMDLVGETSGPYPAEMVIDLSSYYEDIFLGAVNIPEPVSIKARAFDPGTGEGSDYSNVLLPAMDTSQAFDPGVTEFFRSPDRTELHVVVTSLEPHSVLICHTQSGGIVPAWWNTNGEHVLVGLAPGSLTLIFFLILDTHQIVYIAPFSSLVPLAVPRREPEIIRAFIRPKP